MHPIRFRFALALLLLGACAPSEPTALTQAQEEALAQEVRAFAEELTAAMNAHDPERFLALYLESEEFVYVGCTDLMFGFESFSARVAPYYRSRTDVTFQQEILQVQILGPASAVLTLRGSSSDANGLFWTEVLVRGEDGRWLIAHEHESWPGCDEPAPMHPTGQLPDPGQAP